MDTQEGTVGIARSGSELGLYVINASGAHLLTTVEEEADPPTVHLLSFGGETGDRYNTFVFGTAPSGAVQFDLEGSPVVGGAVHEFGLYVVAVEAKDVLPQQLTWAFKARDGRSLASGNGIRG